MKFLVFIAMKMVSGNSISVGGLGSIPSPVKPDTVSPTARHCCDISQELCCTGTKPWRRSATRYSLHRNTVSILEIYFCPILFSLRSSAIETEVFILII